MFTYPKQAELNRVLPKAKIYAHGRPGKAVKEFFVSQVGEIMWKYILSPETTNLSVRHGVQEIQVFELSLKTPELDEAVLRTLDRAIPFPLFFQIIHTDRIRFAAPYKRPHETDSGKWITEAFFQTEWLPKETPLRPLPVALDLAALYEGLIRQHIPLAARPGESLKDQVARHNSIMAKEKELRQLTTRLQQEKQFNRRVELNSAAKLLKSQLGELTTQPPARP